MASLRMEVAVPAAAGLPRMYGMSRTRLTAGEPRPLPFTNSAEIPCYAELYPPYLYILFPRSMDVPP